MSQSDPGRREVAYRLFAAEFDDAELSYSESDEERAPNYVVTPTGARVNRLFAVGVLTEVEDVNPEMVRARVVDPTGAFVTYAGQYQPDALAFLERADPPAFLALSGKARTYEPEDGDRIYTSVRPESVSEVDADTRDRWVVTAAERTLDRIGIAASAIESGLTGTRLEEALTAAGVDDRLAEGVSLALEHYGTTPEYLDALSTMAIDAVRVVAGERDEVGRLELNPGEGGGDASALATLDLSTSTESIGASDSGRPATTDGETAADTSEAEPTATEQPMEADESAETDDSTAIEKTDEPAETEPSADTEPSTATDLDADTEPAGAEATQQSDPDRTPTEEREAVEEELDDFDPGEFELDEEVRREVEEEYGTEFSTAGDVESQSTESEPDGSPEVEPVESESIESEPAESEPDSETEPAESEQVSTDERSEQPTADTGDAEDVDIVDTVMDVMERLDDGDGADHDEVVSTITDERDVTSETVEEAIQEALMSGRCYEPTDGTLKPI